MPFLQLDFIHTRRRRTHHLHDGSFGVTEGCRPGNEGKAPLGTAHLMQKRALIAMQYSALHHRTWKTPTVQNRAETVQPWLTKQKSHEIFRSTASTVDIPNHWDPQAKQQPTGLIACGAVRRRLVRAPSIVQTKRKTSTQRVLVFLGAGMQSKSEPFPSDATSVASPKVTVCVPSL